MKNIIKIGNVEVPLVDYAVGASAILGIRDSGKTVTSKGIAEQLIDNGIPIIVFDAVGKWRWMKVAGDGARGKAYKVVVAGGNAPDLPLTPHGVVELVRAALKERIPLVIDMFSKTMSKADWRQIVQKAIRTIHFENEGGAVHVFLEEAAEFVPQKIYDGETYAEIEKLVRMGGNASVGITLINQRSQEINKAVLDNCSTALVLGCQVGKNAIEAVGKWVEMLDDKTSDEVMQSLPKLASGEAWVWTRKSLTHPSREKIPMCRSFHPDRRTPEIILKSAKPTDTDDFVSRMADAIPKIVEEAKGKDPAELQKKIRQLEAELKKQPVAKVEKSITSIKNVPALTDAERKRLTKLIEKHEMVVSDLGYIRALSESVAAFLSECRPELQFFKDLLAGKLTPDRTTQPARVHVSPHSPPKSMKMVEGTWKLPARQKPTLGSAESSNDKLPFGEEKVLSACIQFVDGLEREQITVLTGFKRSTRDAYIYRLTIKQLVAQQGSKIVATQGGIAALPNFEPLPQGEELQNYWRSKLPSGERQLFEHIVAVYPSAISKEELTEKTGFKRSTRDAYLYRMSSKMLFSENASGTVRASDNLF